MSSGMEVWIDQDLCTGDGLCEEHCPAVFTMHDGISYVRSSSGVARLDGGPGAAVAVALEHLDAVIDAAADCPGECIFVEG